ncbi:ABC transporter ATP-binding protein [Oscillospiraceae bacterium LTW-04]|nr:ABC transporter ATP-binding protein [Oscillospiraceae bacterium MB24-C1]
MEYAIKAEGLVKNYSAFCLNNVDIALPKGSIMGLIGDNGAGKTTLIKLLLNLIKRDAGSISLLGLDPIENERAVKTQIGVVFDECCWSELLCPAEIEKILKRLYPTWDTNLFYSHLDRFSLPAKKKIKTFSRGMRMKLSVAAALGSSPKLLLLDEPTGGLDPIVRNEILDLFMEFIQDDEHSILMSSHITTDLEKVCDYICFLHQGEVLLCDQKDDLLEHYGILRCGANQLAQVPQEFVIKVISHQFGCNALVQNATKLRRQHPELTVDYATLEDIMLFHVKGEKQ